MSPAAFGRFCRTITTAVLDLLYPPRCVGCGRFGQWLCPDCVNAAPRVRSPGHITVDRELGGRMLVLSVGLHQGLFREAVHMLKYEGAKALAAPMAALMSECWQGQDLSAGCIVPVPLHERRQRERGYNQSQLLARELGSTIGLPVLGGGLVRTRETANQVGLSLEERQANVRGAFRAGGKLRGARVLLLDDVCTSGATLAECARAVYAGAGTCVAAMTFTRAISA